MSRFSTAPPPKPGVDGNSCPTQVPSAPTELTLGVDFGTSSTKIAFREFGGLNSYLVTTPSGELSWPSIVQLREGRLWFASEVSEAAPASCPTIRWLKMLLAEESGAEANAERGQMRQCIRSTGCSVTCLSTLFLAHLLGHVRRRIARVYQSRLGPRPHVTLNMGAPLETFGSSATLGRHADESDRRPSVAAGGFLQALYWADLLTDAAPETGGWNLKAAKAAFEDVVSRFPHLPPEADRYVFVVPETHAAVTGAVIDQRRLPNGNYVVVDIGAGTTDVAVFSYHEMARRDGRWAVTYLADAVKHEASVQADRCIGELIWESIAQAGGKPPLDAAILEEARRAKERSLVQDPVRLACGVTLGRRQVNESVAELCRRLFRHYRGTVITAIAQKTIFGLREQFNLLMLGGGSRFRPFRNQFVGVAPNPIYPQFIPNEIWGSLKDRLKIVAADGTVRDSDREDYVMFSLVHGLTTHIVRLPNFWTPGEVEDMPPPPPADLAPFVRNDDT